jgi:hypothetical protein
MQSVVAANNGADVTWRYMPVPIATIPQPGKPPTPPSVQLPRPPQGQNDSANAFTQPDAGKGQGVQPVGLWTNAFTSPEAVGGMYPQGMMPSQAGGPGMGVQPVGYYPQAPGAMGYPQGYPMGRYPYPAANPGATMAPAGQNQGQSSGVVPTSYNVSPRTVPPAASAASNPCQVPFANPAMERPGLPVSYPTASAPSPAVVPQMVGVLRGSLFPSQREWSVNYLASLDWRANPQVLAAVASAARDDPAPTVRAACARCLSRMNATSDLVSGTLQAMRRDADPAVRQAAEEALAANSGQ